MKRFWDEVNIKTATPVTTIGPQACVPQPQAKRMEGLLLAFKKRLLSMKSSKSTHQVGSAIATMGRPVTDVAFKTYTDDGRQEQPLDLCMALRNARSARPACYGHLIDKECVDRQFQVYPLGTTINSDCWSVVTLDNILEGKEGLGPLVSFTEKVRLALAVASSVLQLSKTPWLPGGLTKKNVHFFRRDDSFSCRDPFLLRGFPARPLQLPDATQRRVYLNNPTIFALGILLLEIILGQSLEKLRASSDRLIVGDHNGTIRDYIDAHKLSERVALINPAYQAIVQKCIGCTKTHGLDEDTFRQEVYNDVVMELEAIVDSMRIGMQERNSRVKGYVLGLLM